MQMTIKSKILGRDFTFYRAGASGDGYVYLKSTDGYDSPDRQICYGGWFLGSTVVATEENFERKCRLWYRQHIEIHRINGL